MRTATLLVLFAALMHGCGSPEARPDDGQAGASSRIDGEASIPVASATAAPTNVAAPARAAAPTPSLLELQNKTRAARIAGDKVGWLTHGRQILSLAPDHPDLLISVARANAANGNVDAAVQLLRDAVRRGAGFELPAVPEIAALQPNAAIAEIAERARRNLAPVSRADPVYVFDEAGLQPEGITYDPAGKRWFVGTLAGEIWQVDANAKAGRFVPAASGMREVLGLKVDSERRLLWAVSGVFPDLLPTGQPPKPDLGLTGLHAVDLSSGRIVRTCWLDERPVLHGFNDMALARNGDVYVTDSAAGAVYRLKGGSGSGAKGAAQDARCAYEVVASDPAMTFPNGVVLADDERRLYVAHVEGISAVDTRDGRRTQLTVPSTATVNSIDGLAMHEGDLLGIQGSPYLARVARIQLSEDGLAVRSVSIVSSRATLGLNQTTGVVAGDSFYTIAGLPNLLAPAAGEATQRPTILRMPLRAN